MRYFVPFTDAYFPNGEIEEMFPNLTIHRKLGKAVVEAESPNAIHGWAFTEAESIDDFFKIALQEEAEALDDNF